MLVVGPERLLPPRADVHRKETRMTEREASTTGTTIFQWHPQYRGRSVEAVEHELASEIARDQRAYELALSGAEQSEHEALASVMELEKRWSDYSFGWAEMPPDALARRIVDFELERDRRQELIPYAQYRDEVAPVDAVVRGGGWRASMNDEQRRKVANIGALAIMAAVVLMIIIVLIVVL